MGKGNQNLKHRNAIAQNGKTRIAVQQSEFYSGPLPHPDMLEKYESICTGSADRILAMAEEQGEHRRAIEKAVIASKISDSKRGQYFALIIALVAIGGGVLLLVLGITIAGYVTLFVPLSGLIGTFLYGRKKAQDERDQKNKDSQ